MLLRGPQIPLDTPGMNLVQIMLDAADGVCSYVEWFLLICATPSVFSKSAARVTVYVMEIRVFVPFGQTPFKAISSSLAVGIAFQVFS